MYFFKVDTVDYMMHVNHMSQVVLSRPAFTQEEFDENYKKKDTDVKHEGMGERCCNLLME